MPLFEVWSTNDLPEAIASAKVQEEAEQSKMME